MNTEEEEDPYVVGLQEVSSQAVEGLLVQVKDNGDGKEPERRKTALLSTRDVFIITVINNTSI